ncbi:SCP-domain-containing protein [Coemansia reversa NRRL 1564]|uniref:SCP-domain-containing protein n=1 Tax=Coemansia reversa (strain ATCC 12441 / NRRL 1564) TaxID=763665 RepID=A0A2G5BBN8_COERN|nr:SCP-domain-containing protein [Coemansia reversa NRRL 1564]|eukprot:PIA16425.1 SCP-domain-containing protein [Coemansia reversa NRRL 1564]
MVKLLGSVAVATSLLVSALVSAAPIQMVPEQARRDYHEVNTNYLPQPTGLPQLVHTVTKFIYGHNSPTAYNTQEPLYSTSEPTSEYYSAVPSNPDDGWKSQMLQQVNAIRAEVGKGPLTIDERLNSMAQAHSNYQSSASTMTHSDPSGSLGSRCSQYGIDWSGVAENVAWNYKDVTEVVQGWKDSPGHYENIIGDYNAVGFGVTNLYWTQDFAKV